MFLKKLNEKLKIKAGRKFLQQGLKSPSLVVNREKGISSVGCIVDLDKFDHANLFYEFVEEFSLHPNSVKIIGYKGFYDKKSP